MDRTAAARVFALALLLALLGMRAAADARGQMPPAGAPSAAPLLEPDRQTPRVKAYAGQVRRGQRARFLWRAADDRPLRVRLFLRRDGRVAFEQTLTRVVATSWDGLARETTSRRPISPTFPRGVYDFCVNARDAAGHASTACARYYVADRYGR